MTDHRPIVLLHGLLGSPRDWDAVRTRLDGMAVQTPQLPLAADWNDTASRLAEQIPSKSLVVGYSLGARIALAIAIEFHRELEGLVLISGQAGLSRADRTRRWRHDQEIADRMERETPREFLTWWYTQSVFSGDSAKLKQRMVAEKSILDLPAEAARLRACSVSRQPDYTPRLSRLRIPVIFMAGRADSKYVRLARQLASASPRFGCQIVDGCGHMVHRQRPEVVARVLLGLERQTAGNEA